MCCHFLRNIVKKCFFTSIHLITIFLVAHFVTLYRLKRPNYACDVAVCFISSKVSKIHLPCGGARPFLDFTHINVNYIKEFICLQTKMFMSPTILDKSPWDRTAICIFFCPFSVPSLNSASFSKFSCSSPSPYPIQSWNSEKILDTRVQHYLWGKGRGWTCVNWKTPQKRKSVPRLLSTIVWKRGGKKKASFEGFSSL